MSDLDARIWQAIIAGAFIGAGWFVNGWLNRREATALRREKLRDMHRAIYAEIGVYLSNLWDEHHLDAYSDAMQRKMEADENFVPFIPRENNDALFTALTSEIHVLPRYTIDPIVTYYSQVRAIAALIDDMRGVGFKTMSQPRRIAMYADYIEMKKQALHFGRYANAMITAYADDGAEGAKTQSRQFNSPAADPSDRSQG